MTHASPAPDPTRCPLCGGANACGMAAPQGTSANANDCWCMTANIPAEVLARVPQAARGQACICAACASAQVLRASLSEPQVE